MKKLHPLKFNPIFVEKIWGGNKLKKVLHKNCPDQKIGESWEISCVEGFVSQVNNGYFRGELLTNLIKTYKQELLGKKVFEKYGNEFPLLIKFIDASDDLSIQVHPSDAYAKEKHHCFGKNEMWVVLNDDDQANLLIGFRNQITETEYIEAVNNNSLADLLNKIMPQNGEAFYIPTGTVHGIGKGTMIAEIQQSSDITYRIYDYKRTDDYGNERELHTSDALKVIDYSAYNPKGILYEKPYEGESPIIETPYFKTNYISVKESLIKDYSTTDSFVIYICIEGNISIEFETEKYQLKFGETILIPASVNSLKLISKNSKLLEVSL